jgi:hypothetical protein
MWGALGTVNSKDGSSCAGFAPIARPARSAPKTDDVGARVADSGRRGIYIYVVIT